MPLTTADTANAPDERDRYVDPTSFSQDGQGANEDPIPDPDKAQMIEHDDGSVSYTWGDEEVTKEADEEATPDDFYQNLVEVIDPVTLSSLATELLDYMKEDKEARSERDKDYAEGIKRTGVSKDTVGGADFEGASRVTHPALMQGAIEFSARAMKELFPPNGPVKTHIIGEQTEEKLDKAERKKTYMNWQLTKQVREYRPKMAEMLTQVPLGGSQFLKVWYDDRIERPKAEFIPVDKIVLPQSASDFYSADRKAHEQDVTAQEFKRRVDSGLYRELSNGSSAPGLTPDATEASQAAARVEGKESQDVLNIDGTRRLYEIYINHTFDEDKYADGGERGYIITVDETSREIVAIYRNWDAEDERYQPEPNEWIVEFGFIPWRGAYKIGLMQIIGQMSGAATGALRAILDGGFLSSHPGGLMLKGARTAGKNVSGDPTEFTQLEAPPQVDDIRKLAMPYPFNGPAPVLFQVLEWLTVQAKNVVSTANEAIQDAGNDMPVGTAMALIEQGAITFSSIHAQLHASQERVLAILHRINRDHLDDEVTVDELGELVVGRKDFQGAIDVQPVSDPNIFSDAQRYAQNQGAWAMAEKAPQVFNIGKLAERTLRLMNYPSWEEILNVPKPAKQLDPVTENQIAGQDDTQLKAYKGQNHYAHLQSHLLFMVSPIFCANPMMGSIALPKLLAHVKEHLIALYGENVRAATEVAKVLQAQGLGQDTPAEVTGAAFADQQMAKQLGPLMPHIEQAMKLAQQFAPKPPMDQRAQAQLAIAQTNNQAKAEENDKDRKQELLLAQANEQSEMRKEQSETVRSTQEMQVAAHNAELASQSELQDRNLQMALAHIRESNTNMREEFKGAIQLALKGVEQQFAEVSTNVARVYDIFEQLVSHKANLGEPVDETMLGQMSQLVDQISPKPMGKLPTVPKAPPEPEGGKSSTS